MSFAEQYVNLFWDIILVSLVDNRPNSNQSSWIVSSVAYGKLDAVEKHQNLISKLLKKGYFESGI